jgi:uncharacterized protein involved in response to NO
MPTAAARRAYEGPALFSYGFRPFFLAGAAWSALVVPLWIWSFQSGGCLTLAWHVHEMLFGFLAAVVAGFLTTAIPNWTGRMPVIGAPLAALAGLWLLGRLAMLFQPTLGAVAAGVDSLFLIAFAGVVWREVLAGRNWRNLPICALVTVLAAANVAFHLEGPGAVSGVGERLALGAAVMLIVVIGGRITPSFTRNWLRAHGSGPEPAVPSRVDLGVMALTGAAVLAWTAFPDARATGWALAAAGLANLARLARWRGWRAAPEPLVWILHVGYAWLGIGLALLGASRLTPAAPASAGVHALTAGAVGVMTLAVMSRASRGHTGRPLTAGAGTVAIYLSVIAAALVRVAAPFVPTLQPLLLAVSALLWFAAFAGFAVGYAPMLATRRDPAGRAA